MKKKNTKSVKTIKHVKSKSVKTHVETKVDAPVTTPVIESNVALPSKKDHNEGIVKIISVFGLIGSTFMLLVGLIFIFFRKDVLAQVPVSQIPPGVNMLNMLSWMGVFMILFGLAWFIVSLNLWQFKRWARIVAIVFASLGAFMALVSFPAGWFGFLLHGIVLYFLAFHPGVKNLFE